MNRGLVVNSAPRARVWSLPLVLAMLVLLFPARALEAAFEYCLELLLGVSPTLRDLRARISGS